MEKREMTAVFVCSPFRPSSKEPAVAKDQLASNINRAVMACKLLIRLGHLPLVPHLYFPRFLDDTIASEREDGIQMGLLWLKQADEVWVFGSEITEGMSREIAEAKALNKPVRMMPEPCKLVMELLAAMQERTQRQADLPTEEGRAETEQEERRS